jgi:ribosomal protein S18 acetylase RimI-like enzyme
MSDYRINFIDKLPEDIEKLMQEDLVEYEAKHGIEVNLKRFSLVLTSDTEKVFGVLNAYTAFSEIYIDDMWVHKSQRNKGYGKKLIEALEEYYEGKGFNNMNLVTSEFQAPEFYKKCGFTVEFVRENKVNPKLTKTFFVKYFKNKIQTQGIKGGR